MITDDDHIPPLAIATTRRKASVLQDLEERYVWQGGVREFPRCKGRAHDVVQFHEQSSLADERLIKYVHESMPTWRGLVNRSVWALALDASSSRDGCMIVALASIT